jgi:uncharacterized lipoprotein YddW (UPF0748 family)
MRRAMLRSLAVTVLLGAAALPAAAQELRATWVARDGLTSRAKIVSTLDQLAAANVNCVCVDVWTRGYTIHPSAVLAAACGVSQDPDPAYVGRDPLAEFVLEAHLRGIEVEAWFEYGFCFGWSPWYSGAGGVGPVLAANPGWIARDQTGNSQVPDGSGGFFTWASHEHPAVRQFLLDLATEVVDRYDVDGIQLDRVRYPSTAFGYDAATSAAYLAATGSLPPTNTNASAWKRWRADGLISFHQQLYAAVKARRSSVRVTNAPVTMPLAYDSFLQDWPQWVVTGALDLVYPQVYRTTVSAYVASLDQQLAYLTPPLRQKVAPGIRAVSGTPTNEVLGMVQVDRQRGLPGHVFWYAEGLYDDLPALQANYFQAPAPVPGRPAGFRPPATVREENDATSTATPGFLVSSQPAYSQGQARVSLPFAGPAEHVGYRVPVAAPGLYTVAQHVVPGSGLAASAPVTIVHGGGTAVVAVAQNTGAAGWRALGDYWFGLGDAVIQVGASLGVAVQADAVALVAARWPTGGFQAYGAGTGGSAGGARLSLAGRSGLGGRIDVQLNRTPALAPVVLGIGFSAASVPLLGGTLFVVPDVTVGGAAQARGVFSLAIDVPWNVALVGAPLFVQGIALDAGAPQGVGWSNAATTTIAGI